ncbi:hypothetical protein RJ640_012927, partial [Escallonia rubra]
MYHNHLRRIDPSLALLETLVPSKHQNSFFSTSLFQDQDANPNREAFPSASPPQRTHLAPTHYMKTPPPLATTTRSQNRHPPPDEHYITSSNKMITHYVRSGYFDSALQVFENMTVRSIVTWNSILAGYTKKPGKVEEARQLFDRIPEPDVVSYNTMLACYVHNCDIMTAREFFDGMPAKDIASWNTMMSGFLRNGMMGDARAL